MEWESSYDPEVHGDPWHNDNPFVLEEYRKRVKKCRGCATPFVDRRRKHPAPNFVVSHRERVIFWTKNRRRRDCLQRVFFHCSLSCIKPIHPYFNSGELTVAPTVARKLTGDDVQEAERDGVDLSFVLMRNY